ncbi:MBL fold metallo-hydrolase [candidate division WOR-3 bacterium]|nr:MBL fold metallo-hydrolase [candidate division WOR-3 bacterium]
MNYNVSEVVSGIFCITQYVLKNCPTNCYVLRAEKYNYIIDTGFGSESSEILLRVTDEKKPIRVINTHFHWDHIWGNHVFKKEEIISSMKTAQYIDKYWDEMIELNKKYIRGKAEKFLPNVISEGEIKFSEDGVLIFPSQGHTKDGISVFYEREKILFVGDNIGDDEINIVPELETDNEAYMKALKKYLSMDPFLILSGHNSEKKIDFILKILERLKE